MGRLPFNPRNMAAKSEPTDATGPTASAGSDKAAGAITVSALAAVIDRVLRDHIPAPVRVVGEVSQFRERTHWYFDIKDADALVSCVMFRNAALRAGFLPEVGQRLVLTGSVGFYAKLGRMSFVVEKVEPIGLGALDLAFRKLCEEIRALGWFEENRKRSLPMFPRRLAIVTSRTGAALQDVLDTVRRRCPGLPLALVDVRVQGDGASGEIANAVRQLGRRHSELGIDLILVTRGGGSMEDLWAFNERIVAEAIVNCPVPVVAAIGHETDTTIAELVADLRCATPTQAAMRIAPDAAALGEQLDSLVARLTTLVRKQIRFDAERVRGLKRHVLFADPGALVERRADQVAAAAGRLAFGMREASHGMAARLSRAAARLERHRPAAVYASREARLRTIQGRLESAIAARLARSEVAPVALRLDAAVRVEFQRRALAVESAARSLDLVGPHSVLRRGYSVTLKADGSVVRSAADVGAGDSIRTRLADGSFGSIVSGDGADQQPIRPTAPARAAKPRRPDAPRNQMDLFSPGG